MWRNLILATLSAWTLSVVPAKAATFTFSQGGFSGGGVIEGVFEAEDLDLDGQIVASDGEVSAFSARFSGDANFPVIEFDVSHLQGLVYDVGSGLLGDGVAFQNEGIRLDSTDYLYEVGAGVVDVCDGTRLCGWMFGFVGAFAESYVSQPIEVVEELAPVPVPGALPLFLAGFAILGATRTRDQKAQ